MPHRSAFLNDTLDIIKDPVGVGSVALFAIFSKIWLALTSVLAASLLFLWAIDIILGVVKAVDQEGGIDNFKWEFFLAGFRKGLVGVVIIAFAVVIEVMMKEVGAGFLPVSTTVMSVLAWGFAWSVVQNVSYFYPEVGVALSRTLKLAHKRYKKREEEQSEGQR